MEATYVYVNFKSYDTLNSGMCRYHLLFWSIVLSQKVQVSGCMHIGSFQQLNSITVAVTKPTMLD